MQFVSGDGGDFRSRTDIVLRWILLPAYMVLGGIIYLAVLRLLKAVREHDIELIHK